MTTAAPIAPAAGQNAPIVDYLDDIEGGFVAAIVDSVRDIIHHKLSPAYVTPRGVTPFVNLTARFANILAVSDLIGRARIQSQVDAELRDHPDDSAISTFNEESSTAQWTAEQLRALFTPRGALAFFRKIANLTGPAVDNADLFETLITGRAFSLAATTEQVIQERVAKVIAERIETGKDVRGAGRVIEDVLDETGVAHPNGYGEMVVRTNVMESYRAGSWSRYKDPELNTLMPVWRYVGIKDGRQRQGPEPEKPDHRIHTGKYWPRSVEFTAVRGTAARDVIRCRCDFAALSKRQWAKLEAGGARLEVAQVPSWPTI